jgi:hypothetical protein
MRRRRWSDLRRPSRRRERRPHVLIVCEGEKTENSYFRRLKHATRARGSLIEVKIIGLGAVPATVVDEAIEAKREAERSARRNDESWRYDQVWCVFDRDEHPGVQEAYEKAVRAGLRVALSVPCFELWLLLHFRDWRQSHDRKHIQAKCRGHLPDFEKELDEKMFAELWPLVGTAIDRARELKAWQATRGCKPWECNPLTDVHELT